MSKKLFTLYYGDRVKIAPKNKIVKADTISKTFELKEMIDHVHEEEKKYRIDIVSECEQIKEQAKKEGFEEGFNQWAEQLASMEAEIMKVREELEKILTPITLKAAKKIVGREIELSKDTVVDIITNVLKSVAQHKKVAVYANPKDLEILENNRPRLKEIFESLEALSLRPREDIETGGCVIETEGGIINARLDNQWKILEQAFESMFTPESFKKLREDAKESSVE